VGRVGTMKLFNFDKEQVSLCQVYYSRDCPLSYGSIQVSLYFYELLTTLACVHGLPGRLSVCKHSEALLYIA
jgi:hypothetical protein